MRRRLPPLRSVVYFEAVAENESIVMAGEQLGVTKGAVSQQIRLLEEYLGIELFNRSGRTISLNDAGQRYYSSVHSSLSNLEQATTRVSRKKSRTTFRLTVLPAFASMWLVHRLAEFQNEFPYIDIEIAADATMTDFTRTDIHLGIRYSRGEATNLIAKDLCTDTLFPVCSQAYFEKMGLNQPSDLKHCRLLHDTYWNEDWQRWCNDTNTPLPNRQEGQYFTHYSVAIDAAISNGGVAMGHALLVERLLSEGKLVRLFNISIPALEPYVIVHPERFSNLSFVIAFEKWIKSHFQDKQ